MKNLYLKHGIFENRYLIGAFILGVFLQIGVVLIPNVAGIFKLVALNNIQWLYVTLISVFPVIIMEIQKKFEEIKFGKIIYKNEMITEK